MIAAAATVFALMLPLVLAALCLTRIARGPAWALAPWAALPALVLALAGQPQAPVELAWLLFGMRLGLNGVTRVFLLFSALLWLIAGHFARAYFAGDTQRLRFAAFFLLTLTGNLGLILARDAASFYLFFALMTFAAYGLIIHTGEERAHRAGRVYIVLAVLGEALLLSGLVMAAGAADSLDLARIPAGVAAAPRRDLIVALLFAGFGVKAGVLLLHVWLPLAHPVAPTPASAVLSGAMIKAGLLGWLHFLPAGESMLPGWSAALAAAGLAAAFYGVAIGLTQRDPKAVLAYSSVSQMGFMTIAVGAALATPDAAHAAVAAAAFYALHHGFAKGALFLGAGVPHGARGGPSLPVLAGLLLPALALSGAPFTSGASAKHQLKDALGLVPWGETVEPLLSAAAVGTTLIMARFLVLVYRQAEPGEARGALMLAWSAAVLASVAAAWVLPDAWLALPVRPAPDPWSEAWPLLTGIALALLAARWRGWWRDWHVPPGDVLGVAARMGAWLVALLGQLGSEVGVQAQMAYAFLQKEWTMVRAYVYPVSERGEQRLLSDAGIFTLIVLMLLIVLSALMSA